MKKKLTAVLLAYIPGGYPGGSIRPAGYGIRYAYFCDGAPNWFILSMNPV